MKMILKKFFLWVSDPLVNKNMAIKRYFDNKAVEEKWQDLFGRNNEIVHELSPGIKIHLQRNNKLSEFILFKDFEKAEIQFITHFLQPGDTVLEIGANIGLHALYESRAVGTEGRVIAFEPAPDTFKSLQSNILLNECTNITAVNAGISSRKETLVMNTSQYYDAWNTLADSRLLENNASLFNGKVNIEVESLDQYLTDNDIAKSEISFVKIDVEGWEQFVFEGGRNFFENYAPVLMIEFDDNNTRAAGYHCCDLYDQVEKLGYDLYEIAHNKLIPQERLLNFSSRNLVGVKKNSDYFSRLHFAAV